MTLYPRNYLACQLIMAIELCFPLPSFQFRAPRGPGATARGAENSSRPSSHSSRRSDREEVCGGKNIWPLYIHTCMHANIQTHTCMHACMHAYIHTYTYIYMHAYSQDVGVWWSPTPPPKMLVYDEWWRMQHNVALECAGDPCFECAGELVLSQVWVRIWAASLGNP